MAIELNIILTPGDPDEYRELVRPDLDRIWGGIGSVGLMRMLEQSGAPRIPSPEELVPLSQAYQTVIALALISKIDGSFECVLRDRVRKTVKKLEPLIKDLASEISATADNVINRSREELALAGDDPSEAVIQSALLKIPVIQAIQQRANEMLAWINAAPDFDGSVHPRPTPSNLWQSAAQELFRQYEALMGKSEKPGKSRVGPAVRFIALALRNAQFRQGITNVAIEHALAKAAGRTTRKS